MPAASILTVWTQRARRAVVLDNTNPSFFVNSLEVPNAAIEYAERGWRVVPLHGHDKRPRVKAWQNAATDDAEVIEGWWQRWPDSNVGIVLGGHTEALPDKPKGKPKEHWERVAAGVQEGGRNEAAASFIGKLLSGVSDAFDNGYIAQIGRAVQQECRDRSRMPSSA
eukprot:TRINITY_DN907_c0_g1_i6.p1 TRINITY_DN907_c0_g1~~TRINITY_DN907_c0_g1_i6.p1  ORF type:complete len:167 (+),score=29.29 TRINITY_DN907_c0_g1_i6:1411-1911(+)